MLLRQPRDGVGGDAKPILPLKLCDDEWGWYDDEIHEQEQGEPLEGELREQEQGEPRGGELREQEQGELLDVRNAINVAHSNRHR